MSAAAATAAVSVSASKPAVALCLRQVIAAFKLDAAAAAAALTAQADVTPGKFSDTMTCPETEVMEVVVTIRCEMGGWPVWHECQLRLTSALLQESSLLLAEGSSVGDCEDGKQMVHVVPLMHRVENVCFIAG